MPSPFPGMDPWLESPGVFPDFHHTFIGALRRALVPVLRPPFFAAVSTRVYMQGSERHVEPDVDLLQRSRKSKLGQGNHRQKNTAASVELLEISIAPLLPDEELTESFVEIRTTHGKERLVTSIELLSPANKSRSGRGRELYVKKQEELREARVNLVEIDLLRGGMHTTSVPRARLRRRGLLFDYHLCVTRPERADVVFVAPILLSDCLPRIDIPLTLGVSPVQVDLQAVLDQSYDEAGYAQWDLYDEPCNPPLTPEQQSWAERILREKGLLK